MREEERRGWSLRIDTVDDGKKEWLAGGWEER